MRPLGTRTIQMRPLSKRTMANEAAKEENDDKYGYEAQEQCK